MRDRFFKMVEDLLDVTRDELMHSANGLTLDELDKELNATSEHKYTEGQEFVLRSLIRLSKLGEPNERIEDFLKRQGIKYQAFRDSKLLKDKQWQAYITGVLDTLELVSDNKHIAKVLD